MARTDVGQSAHLRTISSDRLHQILRDLHIPPDSTFDPATLRRLAEFSNADTVLWGQYLKFGNEIRIDATLEDLKHQRSIPLKAQAPNQSGLFAAMAELARSIRENLALSADVIAELQKTSMKPSTQSLEALRYYNEGLQFSRQGNYSEGQSGQSYYNRREPRPGGSVGSGRSNAGYGEGSTGRGHAGRGPKGYQRSDERIREDVSDSLTDDAEVDASEITVEAHDGEVTLTGTVQTRDEKRAAEACAEEVSGVREVINQLRVSRTSSSGESSTGSSGRSPGQSSQSGKASRGSSES